MSKERELLQKVLTKLNSYYYEGNVTIKNEIIELLAQPEQEPVAWKDRHYGNLHHVDYGNSIPLYASPIDITGEELMKQVKTNRVFYQEGYAQAVLDLKREQTEQEEPVAYLHEGIDETGETVRSIYCHFYEHANLIPLYTAPPKREPLTSKLISLGNNCHESFIKGVRFAEKMHGIGGGE